MKENPSTPSRGIEQETSWPLVLVLILAGVAAAFQVGKAPPVLKMIQDDLGMSLFLAGWILSAFTVIGLLMGSASGAAADALGHRRLLLTGLFVQEAGSLCGAAFPFPVRYAGCLVFSGTGGLLPAAILSGAPTHAPRPDLVATTIGLIMQGSQLGQTVGPPWPSWCRGTGAGMRHRGSCVRPH